MSKLPADYWNKERPAPKERPLSAPSVKSPKNPWLADLLRRQKGRGFSGE